VVVKVEKPAMLHYLGNSSTFFTNPLQCNSNIQQKISCSNFGCNHKNVNYRENILWNKPLLFFMHAESEAIMFNIFSIKFSNLAPIFGKGQFVIENEI